MKYQYKFLILALILNSMNALSATDKASSELIAEGENTAVRIRKNQQLEMESTENGNKNGNNSIRAAAWIENGATLANEGQILGGDHSYQTYLANAAVVSPMINSLKKEDNLLVLKNNAKLKNSGLIEMGSLIHETRVSGISLGASPWEPYADFVKNTVSVEDSSIENTGIIRSKGDSFKNTTDLGISIAQTTKASYNKNVLNLKNSSLKNDGLIEYGSDYNPELQSYVDINLLDLGLVYNRDVSGVRAENSTVENNGDILVKGDIYKGTSTGGLNLGLLGADFMGYHNKFGVNLNKSHLINTGTIEVERDFIKADINGTIVDANFTDGPLIDLGILSFKNMTEKSVGVGLKDSTFYNNGGTIKVGANSKDTQITTSSAAIAIEADNSQIIFEGGKIELEGTSIYATNLMNNSSIVFKGDSYITSLKEGEKVNKELFSNDSTSKHIIEGNLTVNGDLVIGKGTNVIISSNDTSFGKLTTDHLILNENIKVDVSSLVENSIDNVKNQTVIVANNGISGDGKLLSNNYLFDINQKNSSISKVDAKEEIEIDISRKDFTDIVKNEKLGKILENTYTSSNEKQKSLYKLLATAGDEKEFSETITQLTGERNINNLGIQVYSINNDINYEFGSFIRDIKDEEVSVRYINSDSKLSSSLTSDGFKRESNGVILGYGKEKNENLTLGLGFSYLSSNINYTSNESKNKIETWNFRGFSDYEANVGNLVTEFGFGYNRSQNKRDFKVGNEFDTLKGDVNIYTFNFNNTLYKKLTLSEKLELTPSMNLYTTYIMQDNYEEKEGEYTVSLDKVNSFFVQGGLGAELKYSLADNLAFISGVKYSYDFVNKSDDLKQNLNILEGTYNIESRELDRNSISYKAGLEFNTDNYVLGLSYTKELLNDVENDKIGFNINYKF
ncbi:MAG: autotransporter outer membrane beta-barrel domain-containing protein [Cetobacterium sp.]|uniref:autotransporter family protein n=1 Tax=Cetobacterium sp. TaxID=2071632 RepID=UPI003EE557A9